MKKRILFVILIILGCFSLLTGIKKPIVQVVKPDTFLMTADYLYIGEKHQIYILSSADLGLVKKFGNAGEGPGEFKLGHGINNLTIDVLDGKLMIGSIGKLSIYTLNGNPIQEYKVPPMQRFIPVGMGFVSSTSLAGGEGYQVQGIALFDQARQRKKILLKTNNPIGMGVKMYVPKPNYKYLVYQNKIYLSSRLDKISILVFDFEGTKLTNLDYRMEKLTIPRRYIEKLKNYYRTDPNWKNFWGYLKQFLTFPDNFPAVRDYFIDHDLIYIQTFLVKGDRIQWMVFDLKGNLKGQAYLPNFNFYTDLPTMHDIKDGIYYYLQENLEEESWYLHQEKITIDP